MTTHPTPALAADDERLLPCPWCAAAGQAVEEHRASFVVQCTLAGCCDKGPRGFTREDAIAAWNRRTPDHRAKLAELLEREDVVERVACRIRIEYTMRHRSPQCYTNLRTDKQYDEADVYAQAALAILKRIATEE